MYKQFALTIAISVLLSAFSALSLSPALAAMLLKPAKPAQRDRSASSSAASTRSSTATTNGYVKGCADAGAARRSSRSCIVGAGGRGRGLLRRSVARRVHPRGGPGHLRRQRDRCPPARRSSARARCWRRSRRSWARPRASSPTRRSAATASSPAPTSPTSGRSSSRLKPWEERHGAELHVRGHHGAAAAPRSPRIPEAIVFPFNIPTISGFGASAGFNFLLQDRSGSLSVEQLGELSRQFLDGGAQAAGDRQHLHLVRSALPAGQGGARPREGAQARRAGQRGLPGARRRAWAAAT